MGLVNTIKMVLKNALKTIGEVRKKPQKALIGLVTAGVAVGYHEHDKKKATDKSYKKGFGDASKMYEDKFKKQTEEFLTKEKNLEDNIDEYRQLIKEYDLEIDRYKSLVSQTEERDYLQLLLDKRVELTHLENER